MEAHTVRSNSLDTITSATAFPFLSRMVRSWLSGEGVSVDGTRYGPPGSAIAWGIRGCPLIPRSIRRQLQSVSLPEGVERHFGTALTFDQLSPSAAIIDSQSVKTTEKGGLVAMMLVRTSVDSEIRGCLVN